MLIKNIKQLVQTEENPRKWVAGKDMANLGTINNAFVLIENGLIKDFGRMDNCPSYDGETIDATGRLVLPCWVDSHTHLVFAATREEEFAMRIKGATYEEIAAAGGGILNSARKLQHTPEEKLYNDAWQRLQEVMRMGTGAIEIKSGYGLSVEAELMMLRVIKQLKENSPIPIKASFLGAHAFPAEFKENREGYISLLINDMLPKIAKENLADYIDVFCERNYFTPKETDRILKAGAEYGLKPKIHVNQFSISGGIKTAVENNALSVDHLEVLSDEDVEALKSSQTMATLLPSCSFFLSLPYAPARKLIEAGRPVALATDYNPGSTPSGNMNLVVSLACIKMKMTPEEAVNAATINGAHAMEVQDEVGNIARGKRANLIITEAVSSLAFLPYSFGQNHIEKVVINGAVV